ncbi:MAG: DNA gyrase subunit A, partial [Desulfitobacterium sp.]|nr:DNA gyrase subunit A [Desulfitobacterium sp.]
IVKKTGLEEFDTSRKSGLIAITLVEDNELIGVRLTKSGDSLIMATRKGMSIRFLESDVRQMGRTAQGVKGIHLDKDDYVVSMDVIYEEEAEILSMTEYGYSKRTDASEYRIQGRGGKGIIASKLNDKTGDLVGLRVINPEDELMVITDDGVIIRQEVSGISKLGRNSQGVMAMRTGESKVVAIAKVAHKDDEDEEEDIEDNIDE